jgi:hypothetical protein
MAEVISISGQLRSYNQTPIHMIEVTVYRDQHFVDHGYSNEEGKYTISVPMGEPITVRFDTHSSLTNAREWHPSVVANVDAKKDIVLDRILMRVGTVDSETSAIDALTAYQFCAMWTARDTDSAYAEYAAFRVSQMKFTIEVLLDIQKKLEEHFRKQARLP